MPAMTHRGSRPVTWLALAMALAVIAVGVLAQWDAQRESEATLADFGDEQATLAKTLAVALGHRLRTASADPDDIGSWRSGSGGVERPGSVVVLLQPPQQADLITLDGSYATSVPLQRGLSQGLPFVRLSRPESAALGLPERMAIAGLAHSEAGLLGAWGICVVASAERVRDRQLRAQWRLRISIIVAASLVLLFGGLAARRQRSTLALRHQLSLAEVRSQSDERLTLANRAATLGTLAMGIAHETATPLGIIAGRAEQLARSPTSEEKVQKLSRMIIEQAEHISRVMRSFLGLARGDNPTAAAVQPAELARNAASLVAHVFDKAGVTLAQDIAPDLPLLFGDQRLLEHALVNLLLNASHACAPRGHVTLGIRAHSQRVAFSVVDDGPGISDDVAQRATEPFFTTKAKEQGTGLGLAIVNEIVKAHRGSFSLRSAGARGTRAGIELPVQAAASSLQEPPVT